MSSGSERNDFASGGLRFLFRSSCRALGLTMDRRLGFPRGCGTRFGFGGAANRLGGRGRLGARYEGGGGLANGRTRGAFGDIDRACAGLFELCEQVVQAALDRVEPGKAGFGRFQLVDNAMHQIFEPGRRAMGKVRERALQLVEASSDLGDGRCSGVVARGLDTFAKLIDAPLEPGKGAQHLRVSGGAALELMGEHLDLVDQHLEHVGGKRARQQRADLTELALDTRDRRAVEALDVQHIELARELLQVGFDRAKAFGGTDFGERGTNFVKRRGDLRIILARLGAGSQVDVFGQYLDRALQRLDRTARREFRERAAEVHDLVAQFLDRRRLDARAAQMLHLVGHSLELTLQAAEVGSKRRRLRLTAGAAQVLHLVGHGLELTL